MKIEVLSELFSILTKNDKGLSDISDILFPYHSFILFVWADINIMNPLLEHGYMTIPVLDDPETRRLFREGFVDAMTRFPEYRRNPTDALRTLDGALFGDRHSNYAMGGFGAFGNPAAFHNPFIRTVRMVAQAYAIPVFQDLLRSRTTVYDPAHPEMAHGGTDPIFIEQLFGRMCLRPAGTSTTREHWHRDLNPTAVAGDEVFGGWLNLDDTPQIFSCAPGTHTDPVETTGPVRRPKGSDSGFRRQPPPPPSDRARVKIPPGHLLIFFQRLLHEVAPRLQKQPSYRIFICWRLTHHRASTLQRESVASIVAAQAVPRLPSDQIPVVFGANHASFHLHKETGPIAWSARLLDERCLETRDAGHRLAHRPLRSLREYGFPLYEPYYPIESHILTPQCDWSIPNPSTFVWTPEALRTGGFVHHPDTITMHLDIR